MKAIGFSVLAVSSRARSVRVGVRCTVLQMYSVADVPPVFYEDLRF